MHFFKTPFFLFLAVSAFFSLPLSAHDDRDESALDADYDLYDRNRDGLDWNKYDYPNEAGNGSEDCPECRRHYHQNSYYR